MTGGTYMRFGTLRNRLQVDDPGERSGHRSAAAVDDHAEELEVEAVARRAARLDLRPVLAVLVRARAAVLVAGRARSAVPVVAVLAGAELVDRAVLAVPARLKRARRHVEPDGRSVRVGERAAHELPVLAAGAPAPAALGAEGRRHLEGLALGGRIGARVERRLQLPHAAA